MKVAILNSLNGADLDASTAIKVAAMTTEGGNSN